MMRKSLRPLRHARAWIRGRLGPRAAILLYHRVYEGVSDPYLLCVSPQHFEEHLQVIRSVAHPLSLSDFVRRLHAGSLPERAVCVTFDDGYHDNLYIAQPLLDRYDVKATVFMTTGRIGREREFYWDELDRIFLQPNRLPPDLKFEVDGQHFEWDLSRHSIYSESDYQQHKDWSVVDDNSPTVRHAVLLAVHTILKPLNAERQNQLLDEIQAWSGIAPAVRASHRALERDEVVALGHQGSVEIGGHTANHPALSALSLRRQLDEIVQSKVALEDWLEKPVDAFAYPYGLYSRDTISVVREAGFDYACACHDRAARLDSDRYALPRVGVFDWDGDEFARELNLYFRH